MLSAQWAGATSRLWTPGTPGKEVGKHVPRLRLAGDQGLSSGIGKGTRREEKGSSVQTPPRPGQPSLARTSGGPGEPRANLHGLPGGRHVTEGVPRGSAGGRGRSRGGWLPGRGEPRAASHPTARPRRAAPHLPFWLWRTPQASDPATTGRVQPRRACLFKSGSLSWPQRAGAKVPTCPRPSTCHVGSGRGRTREALGLLGRGAGSRWAIAAGTAEVRGRGVAQGQSPAWLPRTP